MATIGIRTIWNDRAFARVEDVARFDEARSEGRFAFLQICLRNGRPFIRHVHGVDIIDPRNVHMIGKRVLNPRLEHMPEPGMGGDGRSIPIGEPAASEERP